MPALEAQQARPRVPTGSSRSRSWRNWSYQAVADMGLNSCWRTVTNHYKKPPLGIQGHTKTRGARGHIKPSQMPTNAYGSRISPKEAYQGLRKHYNALRNSTVKPVSIL